LPPNCLVCRRCRRASVILQMYCPAKSGALMSYLCCHTAFFIPEQGRRQDPACFFSWIGRVYQVCSEMDMHTDSANVCMKYIHVRPGVCVMYLQALDGQNRGVHVPGISQLRRTADAHGRLGRHGHDCGC
jgi:hypothetical protein